MLDNLRRTLAAPAAVLALLLGWTQPLGVASIWTVFVLLTISLPTLIPVVAAIPPRRPGVTASSHLRALAGDLRLSTILSLLTLTFLADQACLTADAIARTLWRLGVSRRRLLEWSPAAQAMAQPHLGAMGFGRRMAGGVALGAGVLGGVWTFGAGSWPLALPIAALWIASPFVASLISRSSDARSNLALNEADATALRATARRTWRFFDAFVTPLENHLPPDNFQEDPKPEIAHRTSPTNIGLYLLSVVSARDFGWIGTDQALDRLESTLATMDRLQRLNGHFYNWYDTRSLAPLNPIYVSTVDSGNLAGHLIALANACREWRELPLSLDQRLDGVADALNVSSAETARLRRGGDHTQTVTLSQISDAIAIARQALQLARPAGVDVAERLANSSSEVEVLADIAEALSAERGDDSAADLLYWARAAMRCVEAHAVDAATPSNSRLESLEKTARTMALAMDFRFLFNRERRLLSIGFLASDGALDANCYDLLASEARLASFFAIAKGDIPATHWFRLGRSAVPVGYGAALISWGGSMFEYLMPSLVMRAPAGSLLEQSNRRVVQRHIDYASQLGLPWGISESAYNARDLGLTYQYSNFGVPGLGLKRGIGENLVVAPYATALAAMVDPKAAAENFARLDECGAGGRYGFYDAVDYTAARLPEGESLALVRTFMAHHQGMTIVAIADVLFGGAMRERFHAEPIIKASELLLQERMPRDVATSRPWAAEVKTATSARDVETAGSRFYASAHQATPVTHLLSNGRFSTLLTSAGSGYSRWGGLTLTRWREDATSDDFGSYIYIRDARTGAGWSAGFEPSGVEADEYSAAFHEDRAEFRRKDGELETGLDVVVSGEDDAEVRRVSLTNTGKLERDLEITSYAELVLASQGADIAHPAFSKLFVETEYIADLGAILATRRRRAPDEPEIWAAHLTLVDGDLAGASEYETDRARFIGRGRNARTAIAATDSRPLSNSVGATLDPIFAIRRRVRVAPGVTVRVSFWTVVASSRAALLDSIDKRRDANAYARASMLAWTQAQAQLYHLGVTAGEASLFQRLAGHVIYAAPALRPASETILRGAGAQSGLWPLGVSGDLPIVLIRISDSENLGVVRELLQAHEYWLRKQLAVDLVVLNERQASYIQELQISIESMVRVSQARLRPDAASPNGRVHALRSDLISGESWRLLKSVARVVLSAQRGSLAEQIDRIVEPREIVSGAIRRPATRTPPTIRPGPRNLEFFNGLGGFAKNGTEYVTILGPGQSTPAPWINVIANPAFGFLTGTECGGYTWSINSRENQLTPWSNDPVGDRSGEAFYLRDEESGDLWSPTASPIRQPDATYVARHGFGYSRFEHISHEVESDLRQYVPVEGSIKISRLTLTNRSSRLRRLSVTAYVEWVLGASRSASVAYVNTHIDLGTGAVFACNPFNIDFGARIAFADMHGAQTDWTCDRREFIGRNGRLVSPLALRDSAPWSKRAGAGLDPCTAMQTKISLSPGGVAEIVFVLGEAGDEDEARRMIEQSRSADLDALEAQIAANWKETLGAVVVKTPVRSMDIMLNGWLLYQTLSCRVWARAGFYQASGAYGFRDQLQDGMALVGARPDLTREHLLRAAGRQFFEGDVQHWWLPHSGQGVRTRISDDRPWLAFTTAQYVEATGDLAVLNEIIPFLEGQSLAPGEHDSFFHPTPSEKSATLFEHCALALDASLAIGKHGLPLMGTGDWNDGMNRVGEGGEGESVWLGWFLYAAIAAFIPLAQARAETERATKWGAHAEALRVSLERDGWDGGWYRRAYFDNSDAIGSDASTECRIDSIAQSWAVLSGAAEPERAKQAMEAVSRLLIRRDENLALLFSPPFDKMANDPGYIKGYPPGLRENGGQYTHAAVWSVMAFGALGDGDAAVSLFNLLNPIHHARTRADVLRYKVEPYVIAADVYANPSHVGRGGWTWYTGSAGWMQRAGVESILGLRICGEFLCLDPCIDRTWPSFEVTIRRGAAYYEICVENPGRVNRGVKVAEIDGRIIHERPLRIPIESAESVHRISVTMG